jgi:hypothetical protein
MLTVPFFRLSPFFSIISLSLLLFFPFFATAAPLFSSGLAVSFYYDSHLSFPIAELLGKVKLNRLRISKFSFVLTDTRLEPRPHYDAIQQAGYKEKLNKTVYLAELRLSRTVLSSVTKRRAVL